MSRTILDADDVIQQIAEVLPENDGEFIEHIANQILGREVRYLEDSTFEFVDED